MRRKINEPLTTNSTWDLELYLALKEIVIKYASFL